MSNGYWIPVLHSHLPFVKHPEYDYFLEEHWLFEAITESYIPLMIRMRQMVDEGIEFRLTLSLSPPLLEMLSDEYLMTGYMKYLDRLIELSQKEIRRLKADRDFLPVARFYNKRIREIKSFFVKYLECNLLKGYRYFGDLGKVEIITSCATHGFLPLLSVNPGAVEAQIALAVKCHIKHFGKAPEGIWLPECAYYDGLDDLLTKHGINFFFLDSHGLMDGKPAPRYGVYAPVYTKNGTAVFGRDPLSSKQVWSADEGYPGDPGYRDFYRDIGFDLDFDYMRPYISPDGNRVYTGLKYYRITGDGDKKEPYRPSRAIRKAVEHAVHFHDERKMQIETLKNIMDRPPVIISPYDSELFGHWWFEGPEFLYHLFYEINKEKYIRTTTPSEYLGLYSQNQVISPSPASWGDKGYFETWLNNENDWIYRHLHYMADTLEGLADTFYNETDLINVRILNQLARELLLAQSSDWAFLMTTKTAREYSTKRTKEHISNFNELLKGLREKKVDLALLEWTEHKNSIFEDMDFRVYSRKKSK